MIKQQLEQKITEILTEFNFGFVSLDELTLYVKEFSEELSDEDLKKYSSGGWREKLIFSFFVAYLEKKKYLNSIYSDLTHDINAKYLKGYLLAIILLSENSKQDTERLQIILDNPSLFSHQRCWINSAIDILSGISTQMDTECEKVKNKLLFAKRLIENR